MPSPALLEAQCLPREGRGVLRWLAFAVLAAAPVFVIVVYVVAGLLWEIVLAAAAAAAGRAALRSDRAPATRLRAAFPLGIPGLMTRRPGRRSAWRKAGFLLTASNSGRSGSS